MDSTALWLTLRLATCTTVVLTIIAIPLSYWLANTQWRGRTIVEAFVALPLVLPPSVLGFYILMSTGPRSPLGKLYEGAFDSTLPFTFEGILLASVLYNMPFAVRPFTTAFSAVDQKLVEASWCLGESRLATFIRITLPQCRPGILTGIVLSFAHSVGEFGVVLMVGGNLPGVTRTLSISIYDDVQAMDYIAASQTSLGLVIFAFAVLWVTYALGQRGMNV